MEEYELSEVYRYPEPMQPRAPYMLAQPEPCYPQVAYGECYGPEVLPVVDDEGSSGGSRHRSSRRRRRRDDSTTTASSSRSSSPSIGSASRAPTERDFREPTFLDAFRVLSLENAAKSKSTTQYLMTKKKRDRINELLEADGLGSKRLLFYPRRHGGGAVAAIESRTSTTSDRRVKVEGTFLRNYKDGQLKREDAPVAKLKRWELLLYKKLGFVHAV